MEELIRQAAQGEVVHNDDTTNKVLNLTPEQRAAAAAKDADESRTGVFTSGIVSTHEGRQIALFFTGVKHAGENLGDVLARRAAHQPPPIQMSDSLSWNTCGDFETLVSHCLTHARRKYVDVVRDFPRRSGMSSRNCERSTTTTPWPARVACRPRSDCVCIRRRAGR